MDIKHELGGDMRISLDATDIDRLRNHGNCMDSVILDGVELKTIVLQEDYITEPIAETDGHEVRVFLPERAVLPVDVPVFQLSPSARFYFGESGKIVLSALVEV